jgi:methyl-accepting chemotaxis protein
VNQVQTTFGIIKKGLAESLAIVARLSDTTNERSSGMAENISKITNDLVNKASELLDAIAFFQCDES